MDPNEIIKAAPEIAKAAAPIAAAIPFTGIVKRMLGPAADELAEMWRDQVRLYRYERQLKLIEKAEKMAQNAGFIPKAVPPKILFPLLEGASMEDDEDLHTMWAALLANASSRNQTIIRPNFISLLKDMAPDEAALLRATHMHAENYIRKDMDWQSLLSSAACFGADIGKAFDDIDLLIQEYPDDSRKSEAIWLLSDAKAKWKALSATAQKTDYRIDEVLQRFRSAYLSLSPRCPRFPEEDDNMYMARYLTCCEVLLKAGLIEHRTYPPDPLLGIRLSSKGKIFWAACTPPRKTP